MDYFKSRQNLRGIVLALGIACTASNAFAVSLANLQRMPGLTQPWPYNRKLL